MVKFLDKNPGFTQWTANRATVRPRSKFGGFLWWFILFLLAWWLVSYWVAPKTKKTTENKNETAMVMDVSAVPVSEIKSDKISAKIQGLRISDIKLNEFTKTDKKSKEQKPVSLLADKNNFTEIGFLATGTTAPVPTTVWKQKNNDYTWRNNSGVEFKRTLDAKDYLITVTDTITNKTKNDITVTPYVRILRSNNEKSYAGVFTGFVTYVNSHLKHTNWRTLDKKSYAYSTTHGFAGFADQYWESFASIDRPDQTISAKKSDKNYQTDISAAAVPIPAGKTETITTNIFAGPRAQDALSAVENKIAGATKTIDYGWFWFLVRPMLWILNLINSLVMNYGIAIIILTILLRFLLWPLTRKSYTSMAAMQKMQPEMARIQKLYAGDKARLQMEMMRLYQTHRTSPMSGCLPMLVQIPIFFALYKALLISVPMRNAHFLWIHDLATMDPYYILPILMGLTMWWQQHLQSVSKDNKATGEGVAASTQKIMKWMPVFFTVMFAWMPAGLILYWTVSNLFGIGQIYIIKKRMKK